MGFLYRITSHTTEGFQIACWCRNLCYYFVVLLHYYFSFGLFHYLARGSGGEVLWWVSVCVSVCQSVCLSVHKDMSGTTCTIFTSFSLHVAYDHGLVLLQQDDKIPRGKGSFGGFPPHWKCIVTRSLQITSCSRWDHSIAAGGWRECTVQAMHSLQITSCSRRDHFIVTGGSLECADSTGEVLSMIALFHSASVYV